MEPLSAVPQADLADTSAESRRPVARLFQRPFREQLFTPVDIASLVVFRIAFGAIMLWEVRRFFQYGWIDRYYIEPVFHFSYYGFDWVRPWPPLGMHLHFYLLGGCAACILLGLFYRFAAALFFVGFTYVFLLDEARYLNHFYLIGLVALLMVFIPAHRACSFDALKGRAGPVGGVPAWTVWLLRFQIGAVYFYGGIAKLYGDWLFRAEPMRIWLSNRWEYPLIGPYVHDDWFVNAVNYGALAFDLAIVPLLLWRRTRPVAFVLAVGFNLSNAWLFHIGVFPWFMIAGTLLFFPPSWPRRLGLGRVLPSPPDRVDDAYRPSPKSRAVVVSLLGLYCAFQLLFPLRHLLYPGDCRWTEEGRPFAWHMKNRDKIGWVDFLVVDPKSGKVWRLDEEHYVDETHQLAEWQIPRMTVRPEMILQFSHFLADEFRRRGYDDVEVYADACVKLNGRPLERMIDPDVNLAAERRSLWPVKWILPRGNPCE